MSWTVVYQEESRTSQVTLPPTVGTGDLVLSIAKTSSSYISGLPTSISVLPTQLGLANGIPRQFFVSGEGQAKESVTVTGGPPVSALFQAAAEFIQPGDGSTWKATPTGIWGGINTKLAVCVIRSEPQVDEVYVVWDSRPGWNADEFLDRGSESNNSPPIVAFPHRESYDEHSDLDYIGFHGMAVASNPDIDPGPSTEFTPNDYLSGGGGMFPTEVDGVAGSHFQLVEGVNNGGRISEGSWSHYDIASFGFSVLISRYMPTYGTSVTENQGIGIGNLICVEPRIGARPMSYEDDNNPFTEENPSGVPVLDKETCTLYSLGDVANEGCES